jgi:AbrB family looped-hinge helix DNA binding protein
MRAVSTTRCLGTGEALRARRRWRGAGGTHDYAINYLWLSISSCRLLSMRTKVTKRGQVSVPAEVRKKLHIGPDIKLEWLVEGNAARVIPLRSDPAKTFRGSGKKGMVRRLLRERHRDRRRDNTS